MLDTDRAYILGLIIGGGIWGEVEDVFKIRLPYNRWGSYVSSPERAGQISSDILRHLSPLFKAVYDISISYEASRGGTWEILCEGDLSELKKELMSYGINCEGEMRKTADIDNIITHLIDDNLIRRFIAGLADTIGSTTQSHRRFSDDKQIVSFEVPGFSFKFIQSLCSLLHSIGCYPDQILWNHPNFHSGDNPYYKTWKKGFKLRVYLDQYEKFGAFAFTSKSISARDNQRLQSGQNQAIPCPTRPIRDPSMSCVHIDEDSNLLPDEIRGGHYLHNRHVCAVLQCKYAPYREVDKILNEAENYINPFPILTKGTLEDINNIIESEPIYKNRIYRTYKIKIDELLVHERSNTKLLFEKNGAGYPVNKIISGMVFLMAAKMKRLNGLRPRGSQEEILEAYQSTYPNDDLIMEVPEIFTPLIMKKEGYAAIIGPLNPKVYKKLIKRSPENAYKIEVIDIVEEDLK